MTLGWALPVIAIRVRVFAEKRSREDDGSGSSFADQHQHSSRHACRVSGAVLLVSLLPVEVVSYRVAARHSFEALVDCFVAAA
jgi:hypothetical protein